VKRGSLHVETLKLLRQSRDSLLDIHLATRLPFYWLKRFKEDGIRDPSVNRIQILYEHLARLPLIGGHTWTSTHTS